MSAIRDKEGSEHLWRRSSVTFNAINCTISFFQPSTTGIQAGAAPRTPDRLPPASKERIKLETPTSVLHNPLENQALPEPSGGSSRCFVELPAEDPFKEEPEDEITTTSLSNLTSGGDSGYNTQWGNEASAVAQMMHYVDTDFLSGEIEQTPGINGNHPAQLNEESRSSDGEGLPWLMAKFGVKRNSAGSDNVELSRKKACVQDLSSSATRHVSLPGTPHGHDMVDNSVTPRGGQGTATAEFYREHYDKLPRNHKRHEWTFTEREALCLLHLFCELDSGFRDIAKIMNELFHPTESPFRPRQLHSQWAVSQHVFRRRAVYDPKERWVQRSAAFRGAATRVGILLTPRTTELNVKTLSPKNVKTAELVAAQDAWLLGSLLKLRNNNYTTLPDMPESPTPLPHSAMNHSLAHQLLEAAQSNGLSSLPETAHNRAEAKDSPYYKNEEDDGNDDIPKPSPYRPPQTTLGYAPVCSPHTPVHGKPALLYRVYHDNSGGLNSPSQFRAGLFNIPGQSLEPPPAGQNILPVFVSWHLWHHSISSPFISCTDSLIMAVHKARQAEEDGLHPHLSVIDGTSAMAEGLGFLAGPLVADARRRGLVPGMRYKGFREYLVWGEITQESILNDLPFHLLRSLTTTDIGVADLLGLDDIDPTPEISIAGIRRSLLRQEVVLDGSAGNTIGRLVSLFGLKLTTPTPIVEQFVYDVIQGWVLGATDVWRMAEEFLLGFRDAEARSGNALIVLDDDEEEGLRAAFINGVERALGDLRKERCHVRR